MPGFAAHGDCLLIPCVCRYLKRIDDALNSVKTQTDGAPVTLLAHSAGGWLSRVYLLSKGTTGIDRLVTIGSPHSPPPQVCCSADWPPPGYSTGFPVKDNGRLHTSALFFFCCTLLLDSSPAEHLLLQFFCCTSPLPDAHTSLQQFCLLQASSQQCSKQPYARQSLCQHLAAMQVHSSGIFQASLEHPDGALMALSCLVSPVALTFFVW